MRHAILAAIVLVSAATALAAIPPGDFTDFALSAAQFETNAQSSTDTLRSLHHSYTVAVAGPVDALTASSFPELAPSEGQLAAHYQLRNDAVHVLARYSALLAALAEGRTEAEVRAKAHDLRGALNTLENDGRALPAQVADPATDAATAMLRIKDLESLTPAEVDASVDRAIGRTEKTLQFLAARKFRVTFDKSETFELRLLTAGIDEGMRLVEQRKHDRALLSLLQKNQPEVDSLASFISESTESMKNVKDLMMNRLLARLNATRPAYDSPARLQFDADAGDLIVMNRDLGPLLDSVGAAATHFAKAHAELLQIAEKKESDRLALTNFAKEAMHGYRFFRSVP